MATFTRAFCIFTPIRASGADSEDTERDRANPGVAGGQPPNHCLLIRVPVGRAHSPHTRAFAAIHGECLKSETARRVGFELTCMDPAACARSLL
jgi:hypothetical protein